MTLARLPRTLHLTAVEHDVLAELLHDGATNPQIADRLGLTLEQVRTRVRTLNRRARCQNRTELAVAVLRGRITIRRTPDQWEQTA